MDRDDGASRKKKISNGIYLFCWGVIAIGWAAFNIHRGIDSALGWIWNGILTAFGIFDLLLCAIWLFAKEFGDPAVAAKRLAAQRKALFGTRQVYRPATPDDFRLLDEKFYAQKTLELAALQFRQMREVVNENVRKSRPGMHAVIRGFLDPSGTTYASIYHARVSGYMRFMQVIGRLEKLQTVSCETELNDGTFVTTSNTLTINKTLPAPFIHRVQFPSDTSTETIVAEHRAQLAAALAAKPGVTPTVCRDNADVQAMQDRQHAIRAAFRLSPDFDHHAEWEKVAGRELTEADRNTVELLISEMRKEDRRG